MEPPIAEGYEAMAIDLREHIKNYQPEIWRVPIHDIDFVPGIHKEIAEEFRVSYKEGTLKEHLEKRG